MNTFYNPHVLYALVLIFGRPLHIDQVMASKLRPLVAGILVEVDIIKKNQ